jgi:hypothetical protein
MSAAYEIAARRVLERSIIDPSSGCVRYGGSIDGGGYGCITVPGLGTKGAHRVTFIAATGQPIPEGLALDHLCHTNCDCPGDASCPHRLCVNPSHLEPVTPQENVRRQWRSRKTHCVHGHPFDEDNTYIGPNGRRGCRACIRRRVAQYKRRTA